MQRYSNLKASLADDNILVGTFVLEFSTPSLPAILAGAGADYVIIDMEHSSFSLETVARMLRTARGADLPAIVRVPTIERHFISRVLDAGAAGLMIPRLESPENVTEVIQYALYAPEGDRGVAFGIAHNDYGDHREIDGETYTRWANEHLFIVGQIETAKALDNMDAIFGTGHIHAVLIGPYDLSTSLGVSGQLDHPRMVEAVELVIAKAREYGVILGSYVNDFETGKRWVDAGVRLVACGSDTFLFTCKMTEQVKMFHEYGRKE